MLWWKWWCWCIDSIDGVDAWKIRSKHLQSQSRGDRRVGGNANSARGATRHYSVYHTILNSTIYTTLIGYTKSCHRCLVLSKLWVLLGTNIKIDFFVWRWTRSWSGSWDQRIECLLKAKELGSNAWQGEANNNILTNYAGFQKRIVLRSQEDETWNNLT